jgi:hypothetical protein
LVALVLLAGCAGDVAKPAALQALSPTQQATIRTTSVSAEAGASVQLASYDLDRIVQHVQSEMAKIELGRAQGVNGSNAAKIKLVMTEYDKGNAFANAMASGLGQIKIAADVIFLDDLSGQEIARYQVSREFAFGGIYGDTTIMADVAEGFAKSIADILKKS